MAVWFRKLVWSLKFELTRRFKKRFKILKNGVIDDSWERLQWVPSSGQEMSPYQEAEDHVESLKLDGGGWRLPSNYELYSLYDISLQGGADPLFNIDKSIVWAFETSDSLPCQFDFKKHTRYMCRRDDRGFTGRVLAVRPRK